MSRFDWDPDLETGIAQIDDQHRSLFALANHLYETVEGKEERDEMVEDAVYRLADYVVEHFSDEEAMMARCEYPELQVHHWLHEHLTAETLRLVARYMNQEDVLPETLAPFIADWLRTHIRAEDMRFVEYARTCE